jgi:uncharacterized repeat protein (TIGR01451 family)
MAELRAESITFARLVRELIGAGKGLRFQARGRSMLPLIQDGDFLYVEPVGGAALKVGEIVLFDKGGEFKAHRIVGRKGESFITRGDAGMEIDGLIARELIIGRVVAKESAGSGRITSTSTLWARMDFFMRELRRQVARRWTPVRGMFVLTFALAFLLLSVPAAHAVVTIDNSATLQQNLLTGNSGSYTLSPVPMTVGATANLLVVGVSFNTIGNSPSNVTGITYGARSFSATNSFSFENGGYRVEIWYLLSPTPGTNNVTVTVNKGGGNGNKLGVEVGAISFSGADTTTAASPIRGFTSASGTSTASSVTVTSASPEIVLDVLSTLTTATPAAGQTQQWNQLTNGNPASQLVLGFGSTASGASSTTMSEALGANTAWTQGAISVRPPEADLSITKSASASSVLQNANFTYTVYVTNNGPRTAIGVLAVDALPSQVTFVSATYSVSSPAGSGNCTQALGIVTCSLGTMNNLATATITITVTANTPSQPTNTATVTAASPVDPDLSNNSASVTITITYPTAARVDFFSAEQVSGGALLIWKSAGELHNLGYNVYRDVQGVKTKLNPSLIAGSALLMRETLEQHGARSYSFVDRSPAPGAVYWLEDVDLDGVRTMHGPVVADSNVLPSGPIASTSSLSLVGVARSVPAPASMNTSNSEVAHVRQAVAQPLSAGSAASVGFALAANSAIKILVDHEGWYRVTQSQLLAAGLPANINANSLHLYAEGTEQPIRIIGGSNIFGPHSAIEFYGTGIDTPYTGQRVYWLVQQGKPGLRIPHLSASGTAGPQAQDFPQTLELKPRTTYFAALLREDTDNFFGPLVSPAGDSESFNVVDLATGNGQLAVKLQGVTQGQQHDVTVALNGATLGDVTFSGQQEGSVVFDAPPGIVSNGANTVSLTSQQGPNDLSLVDTISLTFPHTFNAESDFLKFTADAGESVTVSGFVQPPSRLVDVTDPVHPVELNFSVSPQSGGYDLQTMIPWTVSGSHTLLTLSDAQLASPVALVAHHPSNLHKQQPGAEYVILTAPQFVSAMQPLAAWHKSAGMSVAVISVDDVYDEFNFGEKSPYAIKNLLSYATANWRNAPKYLLLAGDASVDPRNYLGFGSFDFAPTKIVVTAELKTASDDWFSDFNGTGMATIATGRLPARTAADAETMVSKILAYASTGQARWKGQALMVADHNDPGLSFTSAAQSVQNLLPSTVSASDVFADALGTSTAKQTLLDDINSGQLLVNYTGHGSVQVWSGSDLFDDTAAASLTNGNKLPLFVAMNCLNGFFQDVYTQSLAEALMLSPNGGAVAVWASSGLTQPVPQFQMDQRFVQSLFAPSAMALGDAALSAKGSISDLDVRKTFILFGDPAMHLNSSISSMPYHFQPARGKSSLLQPGRPQ